MSVTTIIPSDWDPRLRQVHDAVATRTTDMWWDTPADRYRVGVIVQDGNVKRVGRGGVTCTLRVGAAFVSGALLVAVSLGLPASARAVSGTSVIASLRQSYTLTATVDFDAGTIDVTERVIVTNRSSRSVSDLDFSVLPRVIGAYGPSGAVQAGGRALRTRWTTGSNLHVSLRTPLKPKASTTIVIPFRLTLSEGWGNFATRIGKSGGIINLGDWFPILSRPHDAYGIGDPQVTWSADRIVLDLTVLQPAGRDAVAASGTLVSFDPSAHRWVYRLDHARGFAVAVSPGYVLATRQVGGTAIRVYSLAGSGEAVADEVAEAIATYESWYGPYPYPSFVVAETGTSDFGQEYPGMALMGRNAMDVPWAVWHEVAHAWWYGLIGNDQITEPWVDEAFAEFSARHALGLPISTCSTEPIDRPVTFWSAGPTEGEWQGCGGYADTVYERGAAFLDAVRAAMGENLFFATVHGFIDGHRWAVVRGEDVIEAFLAATFAILPVVRQYTTDY